MGLRDITIHQTKVDYRGQEIAVRGISVADIMVAAQDYGPEIALIFGKVQSGELTGGIKKHMRDLVGEVPDVIAAAIALASDDYHPDAVENAKKLPFNTQVELVEAIFNETFYSEADVKKLLASLTIMIEAVSGALTEVMPSVSMDGIGDFAGRRVS